MHYEKTEMKKMQAAVLGVLLASMLMIASGCTSVEKDISDSHKYDEVQGSGEESVPPENMEASLPDYTPQESFDESRVIWPRLEIYVHPEGRYYYVSVEPDLAARVEKDLAEGKKGDMGETDDILEYTTASPDSVHPQIAFASSADPRSWSLLSQNGSGEYFLGDTLLSTVVGDELMERAREATGWQLDANPIKVDGITEISIYLGKECLQTITDDVVIAGFEEYLHNGLAPSYLPKTPEYRIEICCKLQDGGTVSFVTDANPDYGGIWVPPCCYYVCKGAAGGLLEALGLDNWPTKILETDEIYPYPRELYDQLFERVGGRIVQK